MTDTTQGDLFPQLDISIRPWAQPDQPGDAGQALTDGHGDLLGRYADAIAKIESAGSGGYAALGPQTKSGDRAYGRYQVMGANIPEWTREALGRSLTPEEFLASPAAQDAVFRHKFGSYVAQYGNPADAASAWLTGRPLASGGASRDQLGTSGASYAQKFLANLGVGAEGGAPLSGNLLAQGTQARQAGVVEQLLGLNGVERYQLWPERLAREALSAPHQALTQGFVPGSQDEIAAANAISNFAGSGAFPFAQRGAIGALGGRLTQVRGPAEAAAGATAPVFHSTAGQVLENAGFSRASPAQWLAYLRNAQGVKGEELEWTGLADRLGNATEPQLTKADLLQHLAENQVELREVVHGPDTPPDSKQIEAVAREAARRNGRDFDTLPNDTRQALLDASQDELLQHLPGRYASYTLPGAELGSYREALLQLPQKPANTAGWRAELDPEGNYGDYKIYDQTGNLIAHRNATSPEDAIRRATKDINTGQPRDAYRSSHWDEPNVLGHVRMNDRQVAVPVDLPSIESIKVEPYNSAGTQKFELIDSKTGEFYQNGFKSPEEARQWWKDNSKIFSERKLNALFLEELQSDWHQQGRRVGYGNKSAVEGSFSNPLGSVPDAPFRSTWPELLLKRMIREAAESGKDALAWTSGETQVSRYDLSKQIKDLRVLRESDGLYSLNAGLHEGGREPLANRVPEEKLGDYVGKDLANKIIGDKLGTSPKTYSDLDLRVGGEGMLKFYDDMLPKAASKLAKRYGGKVELGETQSNGSAVPVHVLRLGPELRKAALSQGFPLFQAGVPLSIAGHGGKVHTLTPVQHDPFADQQILKGNAT